MEHASTVAWKAIPKLSALHHASLPGTERLGIVFSTLLLRMLDTDDGF